jgi:hypothetical protein
MTPDSVISRNRSFPSRVRSPTPANTDTPPCCSAWRRIISWMMTVLPTPAPAEHPDLAALHVGLEQVDDLDPGLQHLALRLEVLERRRLAVDRHRVAAWIESMDVSRGSPRTLYTCPETPSPTGR